MVSLISFLVAGWPAKPAFIGIPGSASADAARAGKMDFQFSKGRKQNRKENRRRSLFRTPTKKGEDEAEAEQQFSTGAAGAADEPSSGTKRDALDAELMMGGAHEDHGAKAARYEPQQPEAAAAAAGTSGDMDSEYRSLHQAAAAAAGGSKTERNLVDILAVADQPEPLHAAIPAALPQHVRFQKLVEAATENALAAVQAQTKPGQGCVLDAVHRAAQTFISGLDETVASSALLAGSGEGGVQPGEALGRKLQRQVESLTSTLSQLEQEEASWARLANDLAAASNSGGGGGGGRGGDGDGAGAMDEEDGEELTSRVPPSAELQAQVSRLPTAAAAAVERITLQVDTLRRALQHSQTIHTQAQQSHNVAVERLRALTFAAVPGKGDARAMIQQLQQSSGAGAAGKENAATS
eukprot:SAG22_NODE_28_length_28728_cov_19.603619_8_plen_410_part_00